MSVFACTVHMHVTVYMFASGILNVFPCVFVLTNVFDDISDGGLEELVHGFLCQPQHPLGGPLHYVHTDIPTEKNLCR